MAVKSALFDYKWWIPTKELQEEKPTAFLLRQMCKRDIDIHRNSTQSSSLLSMMIEASDSEVVNENLREQIEKSRTEQGFNATVYKNCIKEVKNFYDGDDMDNLITSETDPDKIANMVAGLQDDDIADELDAVLWKSSTLEEFEAENFTPTSGFNSVCRIQAGQTSSAA